jgi:hypothetical protein
VLEPGGHKIGVQVTEVNHKIADIEEYAKFNNLLGVITVTSGVTVEAADTVDRTGLWPT